jgi:hypothetical protein
MDLDFPVRPSLRLTSTAGWEEYVNAPKPPDPPRLSRREYASLSDRERFRYNVLRSMHHSNLGPFATPSVTRFRSQADPIVLGNFQDATRLRPSFGLDGQAGTGKSTAVYMLAREVWHMQIGLFGEKTRFAQVRAPVTRISLKGSNTERAINESFATSYSGRAVGRSSAQALDRFFRYAREKETVLVIVDDFHFLENGDPVAISNHLKGISEEVSATFILIGVGLATMPMWEDENSGVTPSLSQTSRRWTLLHMGSISVRTAEQRKEWATLLRTIDERIVLTHHRPGDLPAMAELLFERTQGSIQTLMDAVNLATKVAIDSGSERLTPKLLDSLILSRAAEDGTKRLRAEKARRRQRRQQADASGAVHD